ncbi:MAG: fumarylacetoacetate hydrolase family protein, partial [Myxococcota bacterium]
ALGEGRLVPLEAPLRTFGIGLSYAAHIEETAASFDPAAIPPVFAKDTAASRDGAVTAFPSPEVLIAEAEAFEPGLGAQLEALGGELDPLLDYEVELGIVLLEDVDPADLERPAYAPPLGFFVANDLSARALAILGEGRPDRIAYWGVSKSLAGLLPVGDRAFVPDEAHPAGVPCVTLETRVNGELRQRQSTRDLVYTPKDMLRFVHARFPDVPLARGTVVLTGTPGGVAIATPRWKARLAQLLGMDRFAKLGIKLRDRERFLAPGDLVGVRAEGLGAVSVTITDAPRRSARNERPADG